MAYQANAVDGTEPISDTIWEIVANQALYNVVSGCDVTLDTGNMTVDVAAGVVTHNGTSVTVSAQENVVTLVADASNPRFAWIGVNSSGTAVLVSGDAAADPSVPELGDNVALSLIRIPANETLASNCTDIEKRIPGAAASAMILSASSDTPVATTSTSIVDLIEITGLSIPVTSKVILQYGFSKDASASTAVGTGWKINSTVGYTADANLGSTTTQRGEDGVITVEISPRSAAFPNGVMQTQFARVTSTGAPAKATSLTLTAANPMPVATITSLTITGINTTSNNNLTIGWYRVWELPV